MHSAMLVAAQTVLELNSIRAAARHLGRPKSTVAEAVRRLEIELSIELTAAEKGALYKPFHTASSDALIGAIVDGLEDLALACGDSSWNGTQDGRRRWLMAHPISIDVLERYVEVVRARSIRAAAATLSVGQPQLSRQIKHLETVLATPLLDRDGYGCAPTETGWKVHGLATALLARWTELSQPSSQYFSQRLRTIRFGAIQPTSSESRISSLLASIINNWDNSARYRLYLSSLSSEDLVARIKAGRIDVAITDADMSGLDFESRAIGQSEMALVGPPGTTLEALQAGKVDKLVLTSASSGIRHAIGRYLGAPPNQAYWLPPGAVEVDAIPVILTLCTMHGYTSFLPYDSVRNQIHGLEVMRLPGGPLVRYYLTWRKSALASSGSTGSRAHPKDDRPSEPTPHCCLATFSHSPAAFGAKVTHADATEVCRDG